MAQQKDEWDPPSWLSQNNNFDATIVTTATSSSTVALVSMASSAQSAGDNSDSQTRHRPATRPDGYPSTLPWPPFSPGTPTPTTTNSWETSISGAASITETPYPDAGTTLPLSLTQVLSDTRTGAPSPSPAGPFGGRPSGWNWSKKDTSKTSVYAAAAAVPIVILGIIGAIALVCLRKRKKRRAAAAAAAQSIQETKMGPHAPIVRPHIAPSPSPVPAVSVSQPYNAPPNHLPPTSVSSLVQPIILGPIESSSNGAYLTGIDTSDMVSITSNTQLGADPFADNNSITGPPPPYRPSSVPPPSFNSRQSSLRVPVSPLCARGMERSPFDDPDDSMSFMSDVSFQRDLYARTHSPR